MAGYGQFIFFFFRMSRHTRHTHFSFSFYFSFPFPFLYPFIVPLRSTHDITTLMTHLRYPDDDPYDYASPHGLPDSWYASPLAYASLSFSIRYLPSSTMRPPSTLLHTRRAALHHPHPFILTDYDSIRIRVPTCASPSSWLTCPSQLGYIGRVVCMYIPQLRDRQLLDEQLRTEAHPLHPHVFTSLLA